MFQHSVIFDIALGGVCETLGSRQGGEGALWYISDGVGGGRVQMRPNLFPKNVPLG